MRCVHAIRRTGRCLHPEVEIADQRLLCLEQSGVVWLPSGELT